MCDRVAREERVSSGKKPTGKLCEKEVYKSALNSENSREDTDHSVLTDKAKVILNQIKAQKLDVTIHKLKSMSIKSESKLKVLAKAIFEKSVNDEQNAEVYAKLCVRLSALRVVSPGSKHVCFKNVLVEHCRQEVKRCFSNEGIGSSQQWYEMVDAIGFSPSSSRSGLPLAGVLKLQKMGTVVFVGHLFRAQILTVDYMKTVINKLFSLEDEDVWDCLCSLLLIIGRDMEAKKQDLGLCLMKMQKVVDKRQLSSSARDKLKWVVESRQNKWRQVKTVSAEDNFAPKKAARRLSDSYEDPQWAVGTLARVQWPRGVLRDHMRQARDGFNES